MKFKVLLVFSILIFSSQVYAQAYQKGCSICKMTVESIKAGMKEAEVLKILGKPQKKGKYNYNGECTGDYSATWKWNKEAIDVVFTADDSKGKNAYVDMIVLSSHSPVKINGNIGIGSTEDQVKAVYGKYQTKESKENSVKGKNFMIGQGCEAVNFEFKDGKVSRIVIGMSYCDC